MFGGTTYGGFNFDSYNSHGAFGGSLFSSSPFNQPLPTL